MRNLSLDNGRRKGARGNERMRKERIEGEKDRMSQSGEDERIRE